jgi:hypothetical protein
MQNRLHIAAFAACIALSFPATLTAQQADSPAETEKTETMAKTPHADLTRLLGTYVIAEKGAVNRVDYAALKANKKDMAALKAYIASFEDMDMDALSSDEALAAWSNLYNAVTVQHILNRYPLDSIKDGYVFSGPWKKVKTNAGGRVISLHDIEHEVLRKMDDPRIHYAINCASFSCPDLQPKAWVAETLDKDLDAAARDYINDPRGVTVTDRGLVVSSIYDWFEDDFGGSKATVLDHIETYAGKSLKAALEDNRKIRKYDYDWDLNDVE